MARRSTPILVAFCLALLGGVLRAAPDGGGHDTKPPAPCVLVTKSTPYGNAGYDHVVTLHNRCEHTMVCSVKTNVNPKPTSVSVPAKESVRVVTWRGSPARTFTADVKCRKAS
jgi:hypothetical protein